MGYATTYHNDQVLITNNQEIIGKGQLQDKGILKGLYILDVEVIQDQDETSDSNSKTIDLELNSVTLATTLSSINSAKERLEYLHAALGHCNYKILEQMIRR